MIVNTTHSAYYLETLKDGDDSTDEIVMEVEVNRGDTFLGEDSEPFKVTIPDGYYNRKQLKKLIKALNEVLRKETV